MTWSCDTCGKDADYKNPQGTFCATCWNYGEPKVKEKDDKRREDVPHKM